MGLDHWFKTSSGAISCNLRHMAEPWLCQRGWGRDPGVLLQIGVPGVEHRLRSVSTSLLGWLLDTSSLGLLASMSLLGLLLGTSLLGWLLGTSSLGLLLGTSSLGLLMVSFLFPAHLLPAGSHH